MKIFKKIISLILTAAIMISMVCVGTVSASAAMTSNLFVQAEAVDGYYFIYLKGISNEDFSAAGNRAIKNNGSWCTLIEFRTADNKMGYLQSGYSKYVDGTSNIYQYMPTAAALGDKQVELNGAFAFYDIYKNSSGSYSRAWTVYFSVPENVYVAFLSAVDIKAAFGVLANGNSTDPDGSKLTHTPVSLTFSTESYTEETSTAKKSISTLNISIGEKYGYTGKNVKASVTVKDGSKTLKKGTDYTLTYKNCKEVGTASVTIKGKGNYTGSKTLTYKIVPKKTTLKAAKKSDSKVKLSWTAVKGAEKYQIYYSTDGKTYKKLATASGSKTSVTLSGLDFKKNDYKFKIRSYGTNDGKKYYSSFSKVVTVK